MGPYMVPRMEPGLLDAAKYKCLTNFTIVLPIQLPSFSFFIPFFSSSSSSGSVTSSGALVPANHRLFYTLYCMKFCEMSFPKLGITEVNEQRNYL